MPSWTEISVSIIVKNGLPEIKKLLKSIPKESEIIVFDTGSGDGTLEYIENFKHPLLVLKQGTWPNSFCKARNQAISFCNKKWILCLDCDEYLDQENCTSIEKLSLDGFSGANLLQINLKSDGNISSKVPIIRLFLNHKDIFFEGDLHEQVNSSLIAFSQKQNLHIKNSEIGFFHTGYIEKDDSQQQKLRRNLDILNISLEKDPNNPFILYNFGKLEALENPNSGLEKLLSALKIILDQRTNAPFLGDLFHQLIPHCLNERLDPLELLKYLRTAFSLFPKQASLLYYSAQTLEILGQTEQSLKCYEQSANNYNPENEGFIPNPGYDVQAFCAIYRIQKAIGNLEIANQAMEKAKKIEPNHPYLDKF